MSFHPLKFRSADDILFFLGEAGNESKTRVAAVGILRMGREDLRERSGLFLVSGIELLEHRRHRRWIVARRVQVLHTEHVSLSLSPAAKLQKAHQLCETARVLSDRASDTAAKKDRSEQAILDRLHF